MTHHVQTKNSNLPLWVTIAPQSSVNRTTPNLEINHEFMLTKENTVESLLGLSFKEMRQELQTVLLFLIFSGSVVINSMVFILFYKKPKLRTFSNRFILNLSLTHLLQAVVVMPYILFSGVFSEWPFGDVWCQISGFLLLYFSMEIVFSLVLIAVDRNCAVNSPLHYSMTITKRKTGVFIAGTWFLAFFMCLPTLFGISTIKYRETWHACAPVWINSDFCIIAYSILLITAGFAVPLLKLNCSYCSMFLIARSSSARTRRHAVSLTEVHVTGTQKSYAVHLSRKKSYRTTTSLLRQWSIFGNEWKAIKTGCLVVFSFILCWLPFFLVIGIEPYMKNESWMPGYFSSLVILLPLSASLINPYLYVFRNRTTFAYAKQLFYCGPSNKDRVSPKMRFNRHYVLRSGSKPVTFSTNLVKRNHQTLSECKVLRKYASKNCQVVDHAKGSNTNQIDAHSNLNLERDRVCYSQGVLASLQNQLLQRTCSSSYYPISPLSEDVFTFNLRPHLDCGYSSSETVDTGKSSIDSNDDNLSPLDKRFISRRNTCAAVLMRDEFNVKYRTLSENISSYSLKAEENEMIKSSSQALKQICQRRKSLPPRRFVCYRSTQSTLASVLSTDYQNFNILNIPTFISKSKNGTIFNREHSVIVLQNVRRNNEDNVRLDNNSNAC